MNVFIVGLQKKSVEDCEADMGLSVSQILALFGKTIKKISAHFAAIIESEVGEEIESKAIEASYLLPTPARSIHDASLWKPAATTLEDDLDEGQGEVMNEIKKKQMEVINSLPLDQYVIGGDDEDWKNVKLSGSKLASIANKNSTKKRKSASSNGFSDELCI